MEVKIPFTVAISQKIVSKKDGRVWNKIEGILLGVGIYSFMLSEEKVPDNLEGKQVTAIFKVGIDKNFRPYLRFDRFDV